MVIEKFPPHPFPRVTLALALAACAPVAPSPADPTAELSALFSQSAAAWNRRDLDGFMALFAPESTTTFIAQAKVQRGVDWIRGNYARGFEPGAVHDSLSFEEFAARPLGGEHALATARYVLSRGDSVTATGIFTVALRKTPAGWKIIHDHSSRGE